MPTNPSLRLPAEWEPHAFTQLTWPSLNSDWDYMMGQVEECYINMVKAITSFEPLLIVTDDVERVRHILGASLASRVHLFACPINDTWARDHAFITLLSTNSRATLADFQFNGWGLKFAADKDNLINSRLFHSILNDNNYQDSLRTVLEGGSIESDGHGTILTTTNCLLAPNRNCFASKAMAENTLLHALHADRMLWVDHGLLQGDDTDGHVDTLVRFAPNDSIVYVAPPADTSDTQYHSLLAMQDDVRALRTVDGKPYNLIPLPSVPPVYDPDDNSRLPATYANFYFLNGGILMPTYNVATDAEALDVMSQAFPNLKVIPVDCRALIRQHGSLHCSTMQYPVNVNLNI